VTDDKDSCLIKTILRTYVNSNIFDPDYKFSESGKYYIIPSGSQHDYLEYIKGLPLDPEPEAFGLHENAQITTAQDETRLLLETITSVQPRASTGSGKSREAQIADIAISIEKMLPPKFDGDAVATKYPTSYEESMNTVLIQEVFRFKRLLQVIETTLRDTTQKALVGWIVMSEELEKMSNSLFINQVPNMWSEKGFLSLKPLSSWFAELQERIVFFQAWIDGGTPKVCWISGFFFPQAFITGTLQNYARSHSVAVDKLSFEFSVLDDKTLDDITAKPKDGCYLYGLCLEGARCDSKCHCIASSLPKELHTSVPIMHFIPVDSRVPPKEGIYNCPVYKVLSR
jgi:dynein heavy chain